MGITQIGNGSTITTLRLLSVGIENICEHHTQFHKLNVVKKKEYNSFTLVPGVTGSSKNF